MQEQKITWVNFVLFYMGMEWELQVMGQKIFGALVSTNTTSDMRSMAQEWELPATVEVLTEVAMRGTTTGQ